MWFDYEKDWHFEPDLLLLVLKDSRHMKSFQSQPIFVLSTHKNAAGLAENSDFQQFCLNI